MSLDKPNIAVIGAGIVGTSCGLWLQKKGFEVTLIDPDSPGSGASSGNACTIAEYGCIPVNRPGLLRSLPSLLVSQNSPLRVDLVYALKNMPWMLDFLSNCRADRVEHIIQSLGNLLMHTREGLDPLIKMTGTLDLIADHGFMHVFRNQTEFERAWPANQRRIEYGARISKLNRAEVYELEPNLNTGFECGLLFDGIIRVLDPQLLCERYADYLSGQGAEIIGEKVTEIIDHSDKVVVRCSDGKNREYDQVVVAAGAFSKFIKGLERVSTKLDTERGHHVLYRDRQDLVSRPVSWHFSGFYATPMNHGLRFAGTDEIAGFGNRKNPYFIRYLTRKAQEMFGFKDEPDDTWLGFRPTFPDSLPAIGYARNSGRVLCATGHHHLGLTLSGITGKIISEIAANEPPCTEVSAFDPSRF